MRHPLSGWELLVSKLQRRGLNLLITGANAKLLSQELATHLTGRYAAGSGNRKVSCRYTTCYELISPCPQPLASIASTLELSSKTTAEKHLSYLEEAYLLAQLERFSPKYRQQVRSPRKFYPIDPGYCVDQSVFPDSFARQLETIVFLELRRRFPQVNQQISSFQTKTGCEVDFVIKEANRFEALIQVAYALNDPGTIERETRALCQASAELNCQNLTIVTWSDKLVFEEKGKRIQAVPLEEWSA